MHVLKEPIGWDFATASLSARFLIGERSERSELQAHADGVDEGCHCTWPRPLDHSGRELAEIGLSGQIDLIGRSAGAGLGYLAGQSFFGIMIEDRIFEKVYFSVITDRLMSGVDA